MSSIMIGLWDLKERIADAYAKSGFDNKKEAETARAEMLDSLTDVKTAQDISNIISHYGFDECQGYEFLLDLLVDWDQVSQWRRRDEMKKEGAKWEKEITEVPPLNPGMKSLPPGEFLFHFQERAKFLGAGWSHRFPQAKRTKWWGVWSEKEPWRQAASEAGVLDRLEFVRDFRGLHVFLNGWTLQGTKGGKVAKSATKKSRKNRAK